MARSPFPPAAIEGDSAEVVAYALLRLIMTSEETDRAQGKGEWPPTKDWILQTYAECLRVVREARGPHDAQHEAETVARRAEEALRRAAEPPGAT